MHIENFAIVTLYISNVQAVVQPAGMLLCRVSGVINEQWWMGYMKSLCNKGKYMV